MPGEIAKPEDFIIFDGAWNGDTNEVEVGDAEVDANLLEEVGVEIGLVLDSRKFDRVENFRERSFGGFFELGCGGVSGFVGVGGGEKSNDSFSAADVDTEIHRVIIAW